MYHFRARYYDPESGRFISRDPVELIEYEPESSNPYQFVYNNPHIYSDPTGEFTFNELQISNKIQSILNNIRNQATTQIKQELYDRAKGVVGEVLQGFINKYVPPYSFFTDYYKIAADAQGGGTVLENLVVNAVCDLLPSSARDNIYIGPDINTSGRAVRDGKNCNGDTLSHGIAKPKRVPDPDFVISKPNPTDAYQARERSWLVGDFKLSVSAVSTEVKTPKKQWKAISKYAEKSQYIRLASYVTFHSPKQQVFIRDLEAYAFTNYKTKLFIVPLTRIEK